jgi:hypothetical protein
MRIRPRMVRGMAVLTALSVLLAACGGGGEEPAPTTITDKPVNEISYDPSRPWVITAVDNHFHDAHPTPDLDPGSSIVIKNAGRNLHNVTFVGTDYSEDIEPGGELVIDPIRDLLPPPGPWTLICQYHASQAMQGTIRFAS